MTSLYDLTCEHRVNPLGLDVPTPRFSWKLRAAHNNALQLAYQIQVAAAPDFASPIWDSGRVTSDRSVLIDYAGPGLQARARYHWRVRVWDDTGGASAWSAPAWFEMGLLDPSRWTADWITPDWDEDPAQQHPAPLLRREFQIVKAVSRARIYATSLGIYELQLNGRRVGDALLAPGWTSYDTHHQYQIYDVTAQLVNGANAIGATLGDGWFRGYMGFDGARNGYGDRLALLLELHIDYADGTTEVVVSDDTWRASTGAIRMSDIYMGQSIDARREQPGWDRAGFDASGWRGVRTLPRPKTALTAQTAPDVRAIEEIRPTRLFTTPAGETVLDFGQNMVGWVRLRARGPAGTVITVRHAEVLDQQGNFYTENLRKAKATATYTLRGDGEEVFEPRLTFFGFQFVAIDGYPGELSLDDATGVVIHSDMKPIGAFECSNKLINQLQHNIVWGQKGNFVDVPTDCPQRDERLGWTGDAQVFIRTACFNMDTAAFFTKWLRDVRADTRPDGAVPFFAPDLSVRRPGFMPGAGAAAWSDAAVICPWTLYLCYGDTRVLEHQFDNMRGWVEYMRGCMDADGIWRKGFQFGDWLDFRGMALIPSPVTNPELIATAFASYSARLTSEAARVLGRAADAERYAAFARETAAAFCREFVSESGRIGPNSQTAYVLALHFDLLPEAQRAAAAARLAEIVKGANYHLTTGFVGTPYLCHVLSRFGHLDVAYELLNQESFPSWLYPVNKGATTIWERWDGIKPDGAFQDAGMNSFNHYAYGAIGEWLYRVVAGIEIDPAAPGYKHALIQPQPGGGLDHVSASIETPYGRLAVAWRLDDNAFALDITIPANTRATVRIPAQSAADVQLDGAPLPADAVIADGVATVTLGSGNYALVSSALNRARAHRNVLHIAGRLDKYGALGDLLRNPRTKELIVSRMGADPSQSLLFGFIANAPLAQLSAQMPQLLPPAMLDEIDAELRRLSG